MQNKNIRVEDNATEQVNRNRYVILVIVLIGIFMAVLDGSVVNIALPTITGFFDVDVSQSQWVVTAYLITMTSLLLIFGRIADYTGRVKLFMVGFAMFTLSSLACGLSDQLSMLVFFRIVQAIGASMVFAISTAIIVQSFPDREKGRALGFVGTTVAIGGITGPVLGGFIVDSLGWQYIFLLNVPIGIVLLALAFKYLKVKEHMPLPRRMDWPGAALLIVTMVSLMMMLGDIASYGSISSAAVVYGLIFTASFAGFLIMERKHPYPIVDTSVFKVRQFTFANASLLISFIAVFMFNFLMPFYFEGVADYRPSQVGQALIMIPLIMAIVSPISGWIFDRYQSDYHSSFGMFIMAASLMAISYFASAGDIPLMIASFLAFGLGNGLFQSPNNTEVMGALPREKYGVASSMIATVRNFGMTLGVSVASILLSISLGMYGEQGPVLDADPSVISASISVVVFIAGMMCMAGVVTCILRRGK